MGYFPQFGQDPRPEIDVLNAAVFMASSALNRKSGLVSICIVARVVFHVAGEN